MVFPYIKMNLPQVYMCSPSWTLLRPPSPYPPSGSSQCTSPKHPLSCIEPGLVTHFIYYIIHISMPFSQIIPPSPSPTESKRLFYTSVSLLLSRIQGYGEGNGTSLKYYCLENPMDGGAWKAAVHGIPEGRTRLSDFTFTFHFHALEKEMETHSSVLAWRIPGTGEPGGLPSMGSHRVGHDWSDLAVYRVIITIFLNSIYMR